MRLAPEVKVGLIVFIAILLMIASYMFVGGRVLRARSYEIYAIFNDVRRLDVGTDVRMAGVKIGIVRKVELTESSLAKVTMAISRSYKIPKGSEASITSGALIGDTFVEIIPGSQRAKSILPGSTLGTRNPAKFDDIIPKVDNLISQLQITVGHINKIVGNENTIKNIEKAIVNLQIATQEAALWVADLREVTSSNRQKIDNAVTSLAGAALQLEGALTDIREITKGQARKDLEATIANVKDASDNFRNVMNDIRNLASTDNQNEIKTIVANIKSASENLNKASKSISEIADDKTISDNLRATISNAKEATEQAKELMTSLNKKLGGKKAEPVNKSSPVRSGLTVDTIDRVRSGDLRVDVDYTLPSSDQNFYRIGIKDIGESSKLNLQKGTMLSGNADFRYGIHSSRIGIGCDLNFDKRTSFLIDLYRPNNPDLEFKLTHKLANDWDIVVGMDRCFDDASLLLGVGYRK